MLLKRDLVYIDEKDETDRIATYSFKNDKCVVVFKNSDKEFSYGKHRAKIVRTAVSSEESFNIFTYLTEIAESVGLTTEEGYNILSKSYETISEIPKDCSWKFFKRHVTEEELKQL